MLCAVATHEGGQVVVVMVVRARCCVQLMPGEIPLLANASALCAQMFVKYGYDGVGVDSGLEGCVPLLPCFQAKTRQRPTHT